MAYADRKGLAPDVAEAFWSIIRRMDVAERTWRAERLKEELGQ